MGERRAQVVMTADDVDTLIRRRLGLILGPGMTLGPGSSEQISRGLQARFRKEGDSNSIARVDDLLASDIASSDVRSEIRSQIAKISPHGPLDVLCKTRWAAVMSTAIDPHFDDAFQQWCASSPTRPTATIVTDFSRLSTPPRSIPIFKLLGSSYRDDFVASSNDYRIMRLSWAKGLREFAQLVQGAPCLCLGMSEMASTLLDILAEMLSDARLQPGPILFLDDDPIVHDRSVHDLASRGISVIRVKTDLRSFVKMLQARAAQAFTPALPFGAVAQSIMTQLGAFSDLAIAVNAHAASTIGIAEIHLLRDLLFSPATPQWDAYVHGLDFPRSITSTLLDKVRSLQTAKYMSDYQIMVSGPSATGKTTLLKRAALDLTADGTLVVWIRPYFFQDGPTLLRQFFEQAAEKKAHGDRRIVVFVDDPVGLGTIRLQDVLSALGAARLEAVVVIGTRTTDVATEDAEASLDSELASIDIEVPERFDEAEWAALPGYLVRLGVCHSSDEAKEHVSKAASRGTRDVLSSLYWLLPETRQRITESVRQEYFRLGDRAAFSQIVLGELQQSSDVLKDAYGLVAVSARYGAPVPIEVLVSALKVSYQDWLRAAAPTGLVWGLLYQEVSEESQTTVYRTRNDVVTEIVVLAINGGTMSRTGELLRLQRLLGACDGSAPAYREYCLRILVPADRSQFDRLEFAEGMQLFECAVSALPFEDPTLLHHMGRWEKNKGHDTSRARKTLERALASRPFPFASRTETPEHIHTTMAANEIEAIRNGQITLEEGKRNALNHLDRARSAQFVNAHAVHAQANLIASLADVGGNPTDPDSIGMIGNALGDVDRMLLMLKSEFVCDAKRQLNIEMLEQVRSEVLDRCVSLGDATAHAEQLWTMHARQDGFVLVGRKLYGSAIESNHGSDFKRAYEYCAAAAERVLTANVPLSEQFAEVMLHIYFRWRVRRRTMSASTEAIEWQYIENLAKHVVHLNKFRSDPFYNYVLALAKAHLGDWSGADAIFNDLRSRGLPNEALWEPRDFLMHEKGGMARVQGTVKQSPRKLLLFVESLNHDFVMDRDGRWARPGEINHAYIRFRFAGPLAVDEP